MTSVLAILALALGVQVEGASRCPEASEIRERLRQLLPPTVWASNNHRAQIEKLGFDLVLELRDQNGAVLARRSVPVSSSASCSDQAGEAAVILAAWEVRLQSGDIEMPDLPRKPEPVTEVAVVEPSPARKTSRLEVGGGVLLSLVPENGQTQAAFGGTGNLVLGGERTPWIGTLAINAVGYHSLALTEGSADWRRVALALGPGLRLRWGKFAFEPSATAAICWIHLKGDGFSPNASATDDWDFALGLGARLSMALGRVHPWLTVSISDWLRGQRVTVENGDNYMLLPKAEWLLGLGVSFDVL